MMPMLFLLRRHTSGAGTDQARGGRLVDGARRLDADRMGATTQKTRQKPIAV